MASLREQLTTTTQMRLDASASESWSAAASLMRLETELKGLIEAREVLPDSVLGERTESLLTEQAAGALLAMPLQMREAVYERVAVLEGGA